MFRELKQGARFTLVTMVLFGGMYPCVLWGIGRAMFPTQAQGSLVTAGTGAVVGSSLVAQSFSSERYFHPRPSAVDYNAASAGGSNWGPSNPDYFAAVRDRLAEIVAAEGVEPRAVPAEMVTASGSGLDPDILPGAAMLQAARVARARGADVVRVRHLVEQQTLAPILGLLGQPRVNVLELNLALDRECPPAPVRAVH